MKVRQPRGETATEVEAAVEIAQRIGYPVLVRPSYVLGGRAMEIVHVESDLREYMATAVKEISHDAPILVDKYIIGKECEIDAICDGETVVIPGIMEHIEPVSYTHLDVYKRQILSGPAFTPVTRLLFIRRQR